MDWKVFFGSRIFKLLFAGAVTIGTLVAQPYRPVIIVGNSMGPTYENHEFMIASTKVENLRRGDVVVVQGPAGTLVKRVAYLPGDKIEFLYFGGEWMMSNRRALRILKHPEKFPTKTTIVPEGHVFVLGDNSEVSIDSRQFGVIPIDKVIAKIPNPRPKLGA